MRSYPIPLPAQVPLQKLRGSRQVAYTNDPFISYPFLSYSLYLPEYPCKNWGSRHGACTNDPIISCPILLYLPEQRRLGNHSWTMKSDEAMKAMKTATAMRSAVLNDDLGRGCQGRGLALLKLARGRAFIHMGLA